jgi:hypothetical protein
MLGVRGKFQRQADDTQSDDVWTALRCGQEDLGQGEVKGEEIRVSTRGKRFGVGKRQGTVQT